MYTIRFAWLLKESNTTRLSKKFYRVWLKNTYLPQREKKKDFVSSWEFISKWNKSTFAHTHIWFNLIEVLVCCYNHKRDSLLTFSFVLYFLSLLFASKNCVFTLKCNDMDIQISPVIVFHPTSVYVCMGLFQIPIGVTQLGFGAML